MDDTVNGQPVIVRTERGLTIAGDRITLYSIMDYVLMDWTPEQIRDLFGLTDRQIDGVMRYIEEHRADVEAEYEQVLRDAEEDRRYWEERNRERFAEIAALPRKPEHAAIWAKIDAARASRQRS
jgi:uncharacterized protein (DUF433 family)